MPDCVTRRWLPIGGDTAKNHSVQDDTVGGENTVKVWGKKWGFTT